MKRKIICGIIILALSAQSGLVYAQASAQPTNQIATEKQNEIKVQVDGKYLSFDQPPIIENGRTLVPMRAIFEALGFSVQWDEQSQCANAVKDMGLRKVNVTANIKNRFLYVMYNEYVTESDKTTSNYWTRFYFSVPLGDDSPVKIVNGRTLLPTRAIAEALGCKVDWNGTTQTVTIDTSEPGIQIPKGWEAAIQEHFKTYCPDEYSPNEAKDGCYDSQYVYRGIKGIRPTEPVKIEVGILNVISPTPTPISSPTPTPTPSSATKADAETQKEYALEVIRIVNEMRVKNGMNALIVDDKLMQVAQTRAEGLAKMDDWPTNHYITNLGQADDTAKLLGYNFDGPGHGGLGENINGEWSPQGAVNYWMSDNHKYELMCPDTLARYVGVGCAYDPKIDGYAWVWNSSYYPSEVITK